MSFNPGRKARRAAARQHAARRRAVSGQLDKAAAYSPVSATEQHCNELQWRAFLARVAEPTPAATVTWYGASRAWRLALETDARREYGARLRVAERPGRLEYRITLDVRGPNDLVEIVVVFFANPPYETYGLNPRDYPRVWAEGGLASKHRMPTDDALCLYYPADPAARRWTSDKGLLDLLDLVVDHLGYEAFWRASGGENGGVWLGDEAEHGFEERAA